MQVPAPRARTLALAGMVSLAVAMGIGRFAFTPLLPMMLAEGSLGLAPASWLPRANSVSYTHLPLPPTFRLEVPGV